VPSRRLASTCGRGTKALGRSTGSIASELRRYRASSVPPGIAGSSTSHQSLYTGVSRYIILPSEENESCFQNAKHSIAESGMPSSARALRTLRYCCTPCKCHGLAYLLVSILVPWLAWLHSWCSVAAPRCLPLNGRTRHHPEFTVPSLTGVP